MARDWQAVIRSLRAKAADAAVTPQESAALTAKANELAAIHGEAKQSYPKADPFAYTQPYTGFDSFLADFDTFMASAARMPATSKAYEAWLDELFDDDDDQSWTNGF